MPYKPGRLLIYLPVSVDKKTAKELLLGTLPEGCHPARLMILGSSSELPTVALYYLDVAEGEEVAWLIHLRAKEKYIVAQRVEKRRRPPLHRRQRFN